MLALHIGDLEGQTYLGPSSLEKGYTSVPVGSAMNIVPVFHSESLHRGLQTSRVMDCREGAEGILFLVL